jgi:integrase/recombinase XerC
MQQDIERFVGHLADERRLSRHTVANYQRDLQQFIAFCQQQNVSHWGQVKPKLLRQFVAQQHRRQKTGRSIQRYLSSIRTFYKYLMREGVADHNPADGVQAPKTEKRLPDVLDVDQVQNLLNQAMQSSDDPLVARDFAMMELLYSSGLRLSELVGLNLTDIDLVAAQLRVTGKGDRMRELPIGRFALDALNAWLVHRRVLAVGDETAVFTTLKGKRLSQRTVQQRLKQWGMRTGVSDHLHPHRMRHSFASHLLESSGDIRAVQELLGHKNISTTQIYTHLDFQHLAEVYDKAHPRARRK